MNVGNTIRISDKNLKNGYFAQNKNGFQILNPAIQNNINLYCKILNGRVTAAVEVFECPCTGNEKILSTLGNYKLVTKYFAI
jgi:hypothetical protein